ncbi:zinc finger MYM-type protein 5 [Trichonephila clavipes]|nr:zinc finger MYM-type protein 5 [Trichonephila clavipes]
MEIVLQRDIGESSVREWGKNEMTIINMPKKKCALRKGVKKWPILEESVANWVPENRLNGLIVTRNSVRLFPLKWSKKNAFSCYQTMKVHEEKEYNINSKYAKLDNFLISASSSSCASASSSNARELDEQILEVNINPQEKNTVSDTSTNKDTLSKEKESENENEKIKFIRNDFAHYVSTPIDADLREQILKLGPYQPEGNFQKDAKGRSFSSSYYSFISKAEQKIERKWLCYSTRLHVAYCQVCWLFADRANMYFKEAWCKGVNVSGKEYQKKKKKKKSKSMKIL